MRPHRYLPLLFSGLFCLPASAADCSTYRGSAVALPKDAAATLDKALAAVHTHNAHNLYALSDSKVLLIRRMVSNLSERSGNVRFELRQRDLDSNFNIRVANQLLPQLAQASAFSFTSANALAVRRDICEDAHKCEDALPGSEQIPFMLSDLLQCNQYAKGLYVYDNGLYAVDMVGAPGKQPQGSALFFNKVGAAYKLAGIIVLD